MMPIMRTLVATTGEANVALAGTSGVPRTAFKSSVTPSLSSVDWEFRSDGTVYKVEGVVETQDNAATTWYPSGSPPSNTYWIRFTLADTIQDTPDVGDALNTWHSLNATRTFGFNRVAAGSEVGNIKVEIATDSAGSTIIATGYYEGEVDVTAK